jgi:hypothetical protein
MASSGISPEGKFHHECHIDVYNRIVILKLKWEEVWTHGEDGSTSSLAKARGAIGNKEVNLGSRI